MQYYAKRKKPRKAKQMESMKELLIKRREEGISIRKISIEYDINEGTLGYWLFFWKNGYKRISTPREKEEIPKETLKNRKKMSQELQERIKRNTEENNKRIKYISQNENTIKIGRE